MFYYHIQYFHSYSIEKAAKILHDEEAIEQEQRNSGFTSIPGQCGYCEMKFGECEPELPLEISPFSIHSLNYDIDYDGELVTPKNNRGSINRQFKIHLQNCRYQIEFPDEVVSSLSTKRRRSALKNDNNNSPVEVTNSRPKRQRRVPDRFTGIIY